MASLVYGVLCMARVPPSVHGVGVPSEAEAQLEQKMKMRHAHRKPPRGMASRKEDAEEVAARRLDYTKLH